MFKLQNIDFTLKYIKFKTKNFSNDSWREEIRLPVDWYSIKVNSKLTLYANVKQNLSRLFSPHISHALDQNDTKMIVKDMLGQEIDRHQNSRKLDPKG